ncbi:hypothetical protein FQN60_008119, partial [Etheostoma spectabile]
EQPIFSTRAHVFQIDPNTKKNWVPTSKHAVTVSYFFDCTRNAIINSTITPNMTFTKTSQKFGQWADSRANTVYGLGFSSESNLAKFAEKFAEFKEAARIAKEKSQEKMELTSTPSQESAPGDLQSPLTSESINGTDEERVTPDTMQHAEPRAEPSQNALPFSHSSSNISKHWEAELEALKGNNAKLTAALLESTANVTELECVSGQTTVIKSQKTELNQTIEELESALKAKEEELERLKAEVESANEFQSQKDSLTQKLQLKLKTPYKVNFKYLPVHGKSSGVSTNGCQRRGVEEPDAGGPAEQPGAASGEQPAREGSLSQQLAFAAGAAGREDLRADGAAGHAGEAPPEHLERPTRRRQGHHSQRSGEEQPACWHSRRH